jgi:hypothetical protein
MDHLLVALLLSTTSQKMGRGGGYSLTVGLGGDETVFYHDCEGGVPSSYNIMLQYLIRVIKLHR